VSGAVRIADIRLAPLEATRLTRALTDMASNWYDLTLTVKNESDTTMYVVSDLRRIQYESGRRELVLDFSEHNRTDDPQMTGPPSPPHCKEIAPGQETTIGTRIGSPIAFPTFVRIPEDVDAIACTIAYDATPLPRRINLAATDPAQDARSWGTTSSRSVSLRNDPNS